MKFFKKVFYSVLAAILFLIVITIGGFVSPGIVLNSSYTMTGLLVLLAAVGLDSFFNLDSLD